MSPTENKHRFFLLSFIVKDSPGKCLKLQEREMGLVEASGMLYLFQAVC